MQDHTLRGVSVDPSMHRLSALEPLLWSFVDTVENFCRRDDTPPYWFNERACVSLLAGAAWRAGWIALEEYGTRKVHLGDEGKDDRHGRCDLYLRDPSGLSIAIEAKFVQERFADLEPAVTNALAAARNDARHLFRNEAAVRVAAVFVSPGFDASGGRPTKETLIGACTKIFSGKPGEVDTESPGTPQEIAAAVRRSTHAYTFPDKHWECLGPAGRYLWPGVALILQAIQRGK